MLRRIVANRRVIALLLVAIALPVGGSVVALASTAPVKVGDDYFGVKRLTVGKGARVTWKWAGVLNHNVTVKSGPVKFHSRTQAQGSFAHVFKRAGTYTLYCTIHPFMKMTVIVR
jgi:plastocyanin